MGLSIENTTLKYKPCGNQGSRFPKVRVKPFEILVSVFKFKYDSCCERYSLHFGALILYQKLSTENFKFTFIYREKDFLQGNIFYRQPFFTGNHFYRLYIFTLNSILAIK